MDKGLPASPSAEVGQVVFSAEDDESWNAQGKSVILLRLTQKEAKRMAMMESISAMKARVEELNGLVEDQREIKDEYAAIISQQFEGELIIEYLFHQFNQRCIECYSA
ncbi:pyruvate phosphate dikinase chloroplastic [Phtheirospermum japonicum]|uniref:Pyruvate phosphate dikinase chloroplastic n=1 Tax=Phtheirospermum japonicum TaxID=374723 RepID=A0A830D9S2_9LAMI|nr:pyruvate phosphate dikinase chloroplastic [Phtheirospermum japonicum]